MVCILLILSVYLQKVVLFALLLLKQLSLENCSLISSFIEYEESIGCYNPSSYPNIKNRLSLISSQLLSHIQALSSQYVFCYGACPTSIVNSLLLNYHRFISAFLDDNPIRQHSLAQIHLYLFYHLLLLPIILIP